MAGIKISALPAATIAASPDFTVVVQGGITKQVPIGVLTTVYAGPSGTVGITPPDAGGWGVYSSNPANWFGSPISAFSAFVQGFFPPGARTLTSFAYFNPPVTAGGLSATSAVVEDNTTRIMAAAYSASISQHAAGSRVVYGGDFEAYQRGAGNVTQLIGCLGYAEMDGAGTVTIMASLRGAVNSVSAGTVNLNAGLYLDDQGPSGAPAGKNWGVYSLTNGDHFGGFIETPQIADPTAPAAATCRFYCRNNGAGKNQFVVRFPTGAVQVLATEP